MYLEISNPKDYHAALYIRLSKEDENEGPSGSVTNQQSLLHAFVREHRLDVYDTYMMAGAAPASTDPVFSGCCGTSRRAGSTWSSPRTFPVWAAITS